MKIIRLNTINYLDWKGIILRPDMPFIEATDENIEKLHIYIKSGHLEIVDESNVEMEMLETPVVETSMVLLQDEYENMESLYGVSTTIQRIHEYTKDELEPMNKAQLIAICEERNLAFKKNMSVAKLEELILKNQ
ncbi:MAG: hypothetical protein ACRCX2_17235 [Paraclostridium sp.]